MVFVYACALAEAGLIDAASTVNTFAEVGADDLSNVMAALPLYAHRNASWYCSQPFYQLVFQALAIAAGGATMVETGAFQIAKWSGYPIRISQKLPTSTGAHADGVIMALFHCP